MKFAEAQKFRDKHFRNHIAHNIQGNEPQITAVFAVPCDEILRSSFLAFADSGNIIEEAIKAGIYPDDRAYGAVGFNKWKDEYTILLRVYFPKENKLDIVLAKDFEGIKDLVSEDVLNTLLQACSQFQ